MSVPSVYSHTRPWRMCGSANRNAEQSQVKGTQHRAANIASLACFASPAPRELPTLCAAPRNSLMIDKQQITLTLYNQIHNIFNLFTHLTSVILVTRMHVDLLSATHAGGGVDFKTYIS